jgi:hypothetical protein
MKIQVRNLQNKAVKKVEVPEAVFDYPYKEHLIHSAVRANLAARGSRPCGGVEAWFTGLSRGATRAG